MKRIIIAIALILILTQTSVFAEANTTLEQRVEKLEARVQLLESQVPKTQTSSITPLPISGFSGQGMSQTQPFAVAATPFKINWTTQTKGKSGSTFIITLVYPNDGTTAHSFGWYVTPGATSGQVWCYAKPGTYYFSVNTENYVSWNTQIGK